MGGSMTLTTLLNFENDKHLGGVISIYGVIP